MTNEKNKYLFPLIIMAALFFLIGFITTMNNSMIEFLKEAFKLDNRPNGDMLKQLPNMAFYGIYALSIPVGLLLNRIGYRNGVLMGILILGLGLLVCIPLVSLGYLPFLGGVAVFAFGIVLLQVVGNPYVNALGPAKTAASRLTLTNFLNSVATVIAPMFVSMLIISDGTSATMDPAQVKWPFGLLAIIVAVILVIMFFLKLPEITDADEDEALAPKQYKSSAFKYTHVWLGSLGIFFYMGVEIGVPSFFADFTETLGFSFDSAQRTDMLKYYWGGLMVGRLLGIFILQRYTARQILTLCSIGGIALVAGALIIGAHAPTIALWMFLSTGLFHSIMWPTIYNLALEDLGPHAKIASGVIATSVIGAGILTFMMGSVQAATGSVVAAISIMFVYYIYLIFFATKGSKIR